MHILVVDDDPGIVSFVKRGLEYEGYTIGTAVDGDEALKTFTETNPDLVILDVMMPGMDGIEASKRLRQTSDVPILMLTAKGTTADKIAGLESGADDYLIKPFEFDELLARVRALLRRPRPQKESQLQFEDISLNTTTREVWRGSDAVELSAQEFDLLELFMRHPRQVLTRNVIYENVWGYDFDGESNVIDVYVRYLRSKLEISGKARLIHTVRSVGYVLKE
ncbi:MAG: response regulator transcription factor [Chloroflexi bacterium]|jgi:two-component system, OmpR family, response regulator MprA|nr:response regulator transcription factor [Chloroflexota bacterium]MBT7082001.1 response regulator transcription factor [Chloroflexota bacterium]MBT7290727.1 response regulator transcription factor [Chloroflexota bacterium]